jgi:hypothetical protein
MSDPGFTRPDLYSIHAADERAEFARAARDLLSADGCRLADDDPLAPRACDIARTLIDPDFMLRHCHRYCPRCGPGSVCPVPVPAESGTGRRAIAVSWTTHDLQLDWDCGSPCSHNRQLVNAAPGSGRSCLVTGRSRRRTGAGR